MDNVLINANSKEILSEMLFQENVDVENGNKDRVLSVNAVSSVSGYEALNNELRVSIRTVFKALKFDGEKYLVEVVETETVKSFVKEDVVPETMASVFANVTDCEFTQSGSVIKCKATVSVCGWFIKAKQIEAIGAESEGILIKSNTVCVENAFAIRAESAESFSDEARMPIAEILDYSAEVVVNDVYPNNGSYRVEGDINLRTLIYTDNKQFITQVFSHTFGIDVADENVLENQTLDAVGVVKSLNLTVAENDSRVILTEVVFKISGTAVNSAEYEIAKDVYSVNNYLDVDKEDYEVDVHFCTRTAREKASATLTQIGASEIIGTIGNEITSCVSRDKDGNGLTIEGVYSTNVLYLDESNEPLNKKAEIAYICRVNNDFPCDGVFCPTVIVNNVNTRLRAGGDVEISVELLVTVRGVQKKELVVIREITVGDKKEIDDYAITLYIVKNGETLWDVAKELNVDEKILLEQNQLSLPLKDGEKIILYREMEFEL